MVPTSNTTELELEQNKLRDKNNMPSRRFYRLAETWLSHLTDTLRVQIADEPVEKISGKNANICSISIEYCSFLSLDKIKYRVIFQLTSGVAQVWVETFYGKINEKGSGQSSDYNEYLFFRSRAPSRLMERYEKLSMIGEGSYGKVYKCRARDTG